MLSKIFMAALAVIFGILSLALSLFGVAMLAAIIFAVVLFIVLLLGVQVEVITFFIWWECIATPVLCTLLIWRNRVC